MSKPVKIVYLLKQVHVNTQLKPTKYSNASAKNNVKTKRKRTRAEMLFLFSLLFALESNARSWRRLKIHWADSFSSAVNDDSGACVSMRNCIWFEPPLCCRPSLVRLLLLAMQCRRNANEWDKNATEVFPFRWAFVFLSFLWIHFGMRLFSVFRFPSAQPTANMYLYKFSLIIIFVESFFCDPHFTVVALLCSSQTKFSVSAGHLSSIFKSLTTALIICLCMCWRFLSLFVVCGMISHFRHMKMRHSDLVWKHCTPFFFGKCMPMADESTDFGDAPTNVKHWSRFGRKRKQKPIEMFAAPNSIMFPKFNREHYPDRLTNLIRESAY